MSDLQVQIEATPNPDSMKFLFNQNISDESVNFENFDSTKTSPLARKVFGFPWTDKVFIGSNFVTVTKQDWVEWDVLSEPLAELLKEHILSGQPVLIEASANDESDNDDEAVRTIKKVLNEEIRPAVAMDGGDIVFAKYENNIVYIHMQGACSGCPSSTITLKEGIETRLIKALPEIKEVIAL